MAGALRKTMEYLGLAEVDPAQAAAAPQRHDDSYYYDDEHADYYDDSAYDQEPAAERSAEVTPLRQHAAAPRPVRELHDSEAALSRITTIHPRTYNEAKNIGENFREGVPVIMNLSDMDDNDAKRLVDFAAGLVFGLHGSIERVTSKVFLLSPSSVEVATTGGEPGATARGLFNQS